MSEETKNSEETQEEIPVAEEEQEEAVDVKEGSEESATPEEAPIEAEVKEDAEKVVEPAGEPKEVKEEMEQAEAPAEEPAVTPPATVGAEPRTVPTRDDLTMAALAHASILVTFLIGVGSGGLGAILGVFIPLAIWYGYREKSEYTARQALHATVYQVASILAVLLLTVIGTLLVVVGWTVAGALTAILIGLCLMPFALLITVLFVAGVVLLPIAEVVYGLYGAYEVYQGRDFRYRWVADWIDRQDWK